MKNKKWFFVYFLLTMAADFPSLVVLIHCRRDVKILSRSERM